MKTIGTLKNAWRGLFAVAATLAFVPLTSGLAPAHAKPPRHAPAYGYRTKQYSRPSVYRRRVVRRSYYPTRVYRRTPSSTYRYRRTRNYTTRTYRTPSRIYRTPNRTYRTRSWTRR